MRTEHLENFNELPEMAQRQIKTKVELIAMEKISMRNSQTIASVNFHRNEIARHRADIQKIIDNTGR